MKKYLILFLLFASQSLTFAQSDIKIMSYNLLIYPQGEMVNRIDTLSDILEFYKPDLLLVQELKSQQGLLDIEEELNQLFGDYKAATYVEQVSNPSNSWRLQQSLIFNERVFELVSEEVVETPYRDVNYFQLRVLKDDGAPSSHLLHAYVTHLKSSQGSTNEQLRLSMVEVLNDHIALLPADSKVIVAGDFNVYYGGEPAYELLLSPNGTNTLYDPIDMPGWGSSNFSNNEIFTQSTRLSSLDDGSGGGMDDRFDFVLLSEELMNPSSKIVYQADTYQALGNNGTCYNQDLIDCTTDDNVPFEMIRSLYHMSDHLPVVLTLGINEAVSASDVQWSSEDRLIEISPNPANALIDLTWKGSHPIDFHIYNMQGQRVLKLPILEQETRLDIRQLPQGLYCAKTIDTTNGVVDSAKLLILR